MWRHKTKWRVSSTGNIAVTAGTKMIVEILRISGQDFYQLVSMNHYIITASIVLMKMKCGSLVYIIYSVISVKLLDEFCRWYSCTEALIVTRDRLTKVNEQSVDALFEKPNLVKEALCVMVLISSGLDKGERLFAGFFREGSSSSTPYRPSPTLLVEAIRSNDWRKVSDTTLTVLYSHLVRSLASHSDMF